MIYLLDTNAVSDLMERRPEVRRRAVERINVGDQLAICRPVYYEILRGLLWRNAARQLRNLQLSILPLFVWIELDDADWEQAAWLWAEARRTGKQIGDPDLLLAALTIRLSAVIVSADQDFDTLPLRREDWRV
jgi:tRNA(fMet)-specific endonuclease VapC